MKEPCITCLRYGVFIEAHCGAPSVMVDMVGQVTLLYPARCTRCGSKWKVEQICLDYEYGEPPEATTPGRAILAAMERHGHENRPGWPSDKTEMVGEVIRSALLELGVLPDASQARVSVRHFAVDICLLDEKTITCPFSVMGTPVDWYLGVVRFFENALTPAISDSSQAAPTEDGT